MSDASELTSKQKRRAKARALIKARSDGTPAEAKATPSNPLEAGGEFSATNRWEVIIIVIFFIILISFFFQQSLLH